MSYYPPSGGQGYPPQQPGYPPSQQTYPSGGNYPQPGGAYPPPQGGQYPPAGGYPPATGGAGYPQAPGGGGYPQAPGGAGYPQAPGGAGYPQAPSGGGYPQAPGGYNAPAAGGIGFEGLASQPAGHPQAPAQNYGAPNPQYGYGAPAPAPGGYPAQPYGAPPQQGYPGAAAPGPQYGQQPGPAQQAYAAPLHSKPGHAGAGKLAQGMAAMTIATHGTVRPYAGFNAEADAQVLRKAMKGLGTDEKAIIGVVGSRTNEQRQKIKTTYKQAYGRDLIKDLRSELSGRFEDLAVALFMKPREYDAFCLKDAMSGAGTTESTLIEILVSRSNEEIKEINELYKKMYGRSLEKELMSETSGHFRKLLVSLNNASRDTNLQVNTTKAQEDAQRLYAAGEKKWGTDEATFNMVMASRSFPQLRATFDAYHRIANRDLIRSVKGEFSGDIEDGLVSLVEVIQNAPGYFARRLYQSMKGAGTNDRMLVRVVVTRSEVDMVEVKQQFQAMYKKAMPGYIKDDTSGDYRNLLLALVGQ